MITLQLYRGPAGYTTQSIDHIATVSWSSWRHNAVQYSHCDCIVVQLKTERSPVIIFRLYHCPAGYTTQSSDHIATVSWSSWRQRNLVITLRLYRGPTGDTKQSSDHLAAVSWSSWRDNPVQQSPCDCIVVQLKIKRSAVITLRLYRGQTEDTTQSSDHFATVSWSSWRHNAVQLSPFDCIVGKLMSQCSPVIILRLCRGPAGGTTQSSDHLATVSWPSWRHNAVQ